MEKSPYALNPVEISALIESPVKLEVTKACNAEPEDLIRVVRVGEPGAGLSSRGGVEVVEGGTRSRVFLAAPELRQIASALLNVADEIDGKTPLVFFDPTAPSAEEPEE